jgi:hypothetical protein
MIKKDQTIKILLSTLLIVAIIGGISAIYFYLSTFCGDDTSKCELIPNLEKWGQTGDFFGGLLNPFFTFLGLLFVGITIRQNQQALKQSETELQLSRKELRKSSEALQAQVKTIERQRFENTFFQLLAMFNEIIEGLDWSYTSVNGVKELKGRRVLEKLYIDSFLSDVSKKLTIEEIAKINLFYKKFSDGNGYKFSSYFRTLYSILDFVDKSDFTLLEKQFYSNLLRAKLSKYELGLLFYVCLVTSEYKYANLSVLVEKYNLLEYLEDSSIVPAHRELMERNHSINERRAETNENIVPENLGSGRG